MREVKHSCSWHAPGGATAAVLTGGFSLALSGKRRDSNMIPIRQIQGVTTHRAGLRYTVVKVATGTDAMEFHVPRAQAEEVKTVITRLMLGGPPPAAVPAEATVGSVADELAKLVQLRGRGAYGPGVRRAEGEAARTTPVALSDRGGDGYDKGERPR